MATAAQKKARAAYLKNRAKKLKYMREYYKRNKAKRKAYQKKYYKRTKGKPLYMRGKGKGRRPLFPRVSAHNRRNGRYAKGANKNTKGRKPKTSGRAFAAPKRRKRA